MMSEAASLLAGNGFRRQWTIAVDAAVGHVVELFVAF